MVVVADRVGASRHVADVGRAVASPDASDVTDDDQQTWNYAREVLGEVRKRRSEAKQPLKVPIVRVVIADAPDGCTCSTPSTRSARGRAHRRDRRRSRARAGCPSRSSLAPPRA